MTSATGARRTPSHNGSTRGRSQRPHTVEVPAARQLVRTLKVPIAKVDDDTWKRLRAIACVAARWGNRNMAGQFAQRMGWTIPQGEPTLYQQDRDALTSAVRDAMATKIQAIWKRDGKNIMAGRARCAVFSADGSLAIRADPSHPGVTFRMHDDGYVMDCSIEAGKPRLSLRLDLDSVSARRDRFIREAVRSVWMGLWKTGMVTIRFDRIRRKMMAHISYTMPVVIPAAGERTATLGPLEDGQLWLRGDDGTNVDYSDRVRRLRDMKEHFAGIHRRIRRGAGRGPKKRQGYRRDLLRAGDFTTWAQGPLHMWSADIVSVAETMGAGRIAIHEVSDGDLPWHTLLSMVRYKAEERGIEVVDPSLEQPSGVRAKARSVRKQAQKTKRAAEGLKAIGDVLS